MAKVGRPRSERKVLTSVKMFVDEKERARIVAEDYGYTLSQFCRLVILEKVKAYENSQDSSQAN